MQNLSKATHKLNLCVHSKWYTFLQAWGYEPLLPQSRKQNFYIAGSIHSITTGSITIHNSWHAPTECCQKSFSNLEKSHNCQNCPHTLHFPSCWKCLPPHQAVHVHPQFALPKLTKSGAAFEALWGSYNFSSTPNHYSLHHTRWWPVLNHHHFWHKLRPISLTTMVQSVTMLTGHHALSHHHPQHHSLH